MAMTQRFPSLLCLAALAGLLASSGCVSKKIEPEHNPKLGVSQSSDGMVTMRLDTVVGYKYSIIYEDPKDRQWKTMPGCESIRGTGEPVEIRKRFNSRKPLPPLNVTYSKL
jgi:hypothetical protein